MCIGLHVQSTRYSCPIWMKLEFSGRNFEKSSNIKFHENPSSGRRVVPCGRTDIMKLIVAFSNYAKAPKKGFPLTFAMVGFARICRLMTLHLRHHDIIIRLRSSGTITSSQPAPTCRRANPQHTKYLNGVPINRFHVEISLLHRQERYVSRNTFVLVHGWRIICLFINL